jgi:7,8-dihydropterin-6-yl-methyl-4-(beta-D-ribofuranosyl)aminobenzene 5'-phosphate synthase
MKAKITILTDNYVGKAGLMGEHGFSALIEAANGRWLFDTGTGLSLPHNVEKLGIDLTGLDGIILSHGHYDHTGGLRWALTQTGPTEVVANSQVFMPHLACDPNNPTVPPRRIGCPFSQEQLENLGARFHFLDYSGQISDNLWFITGYPRIEEMVPNDPRLVLQKDDRLIADDLPDDGCLLIMADPAILILGCTHSGLENTLLHLKNDLGISRLKAVIGGTHLMVSTQAETQRAMDMLEAFSVDVVGTSHCTGFNASLRIATRFKERFVPAAVGSVFSF